jgi:thioesterase domain-containing protein
MGGAVAHEVARRLRERGAAVEALVLIDTHLAPGAAPDEVAQLASFARHLGIPPERLDGETREAVLALPPGERLERVRQAARDAGVLPPELDDGTLERLYAVYRAHSAALRGWTPAPYDGPLTLLRASEGAGASADAGWGSASERRIPGDHFSLLREPHVHTLAAALANLEGAS